VKLSDRLFLWRQSFRHWRQHVSKHKREVAVGVFIAAIFAVLIIDTVTSGEPQYVKGYVTGIQVGESKNNRTPYYAVVRLEHGRTIAVPLNFQSPDMVNHRHVLVKHQSGNLLGASMYEISEVYDSD